MDRRTSIASLCPFSFFSIVSSPPSSFSSSFFFSFSKTNKTERPRRASSREQRVGRREAEVDRRLAGMRSVVACRTRRLHESVNLRSETTLRAALSNDSITSRLTAHRFAETSRRVSEGNRNSGPFGENGLGLVRSTFETRFLSLVEQEFLLRSPIWLVSEEIWIVPSSRALVEQAFFQAKWRIAKSSWRTCCVPSILYKISIKVLKLV